MPEPRKIPTRLLLWRSIGAALLTLSAGCATNGHSGYLVDASGKPVVLQHDQCLQIGPLDSKDKNSKCYKRAHRVVHHHIEPLPRDEFAFLLPPAKTVAVAPKAQPTPKPAPRPEARQPQYTTRTIHFTTPLAFKLNHAGLSSGNRKAVLDFVNSLTRYHGVQSIRVIGHTDLSGSRHYNQWLAGKRAESVQLRLLSMGVDPRTLSVTGQAGGGRSVEIEVVVRVPVKSSAT